jgi:hypothetical protein
MWYVPGVNNAFWSLVENIAQMLGIPITLAYYGLTQFMFWR